MLDDCLKAAEEDKMIMECQLFKKQTIIVAALSEMVHRMEEAEAEPEPEEKKKEEDVQTGEQAGCASSEEQKVIEMPGPVADPEEIVPESVLPEAGGGRTQDAEGSDPGPSGESMEEARERSGEDGQEEAGTPRQDDRPVGRFSGGRIE